MVIARDDTVRLLSFLLPEPLGGVGHGVVLRKAPPGSLPGEPEEPMLPFLPSPTPAGSRLGTVARAGLSMDLTIVSPFLRGCGLLLHSLPTLVGAEL